MKPAPFEYFAPRTLREVHSLLSRFGADARILAGGQSLVPLMNIRMMRPDVLISINHCRELGYIRMGEKAIAFGATARQADAETHPDVARECPLLAMAIPYIGSLANRNRGTICGSLAHADPVAELPTVAAALEAEFIISSDQGKRCVKADEFFVSDLTNCIEPGEMLEEVRFPRRTLNTRAAFLEAGNRRHGVAVAGIAVDMELDSNMRCHRARISGLGAGAIAARLGRVEELLSGAILSPGVIEEAGEKAAESVDPPNDFHADALYRRQLIGVLVRRAIVASMGGTSKL
jgi:CO/xanthine dehydrogenase FAD-binding subunit